MGIFIDFITEFSSQSVDFADSQLRFVSFLVLGMLVLFGTTTVNCTQPYWPRVLDCTKKNLTNIADLEIGMNITDLILDHNNIKEIPDNAFRNKCGIQFLYINFNHISSIRPLGFLCLDKLQKLSLEGNSLTQLNDSIFINFGENLMFLILSNNSITSIQPHSFKMLHNLRVLYLSKNKLTSLGAETFIGLMRLRRIDLSHNHIQNIDPHCFSPLTSLEELQLNHNRLKVLANGLFDGLSNIFELHLHDNRMTSLSADILRLPLNRSTPLELSLSGNPLEVGILSKKYNIDQ